MQQALDEILSVSGPPPEYMLVHHAHSLANNKEVAATKANAIEVFQNQDIGACRCLGELEKIEI